VAVSWPLAAVILVTCALLAAWVLHVARARRHSQQLEQAMAPAADELQAVRDTMLKAIGTIRGSRLGIVSGKRALYELPWYMVIGNPAAGKSSAITRSGLQFPVEDSRVVHGVGGTRHCDWFFTTEGILLDTAGRYAVEDEHRAEWFGFLHLLKKHRGRAPVNGVVIAASIAELRGSDADAAIRLARSLRKRMQDVIERLEIYAPVYVVLTKADLIAGFSDFFANSERAERDRVWGATMPYQPKTTCADLLSFFDQAFDELCEGLKDMSIATMSLPRRDRLAPGVYTFPQEFAAVRSPLRAFLATLFEENPFQFQPVFRGFYFTSALQEGQPVDEQSRRIARRFDLTVHDREAAAAGAQSGYFLHKLFKNVIFEDKNLVAQYASRTRVRLRMGAFVAASLLLGATLAGWSWSYTGNRQLIASVQADLDKVVKLQEHRPDLQSRLEALEVLQDRIAQLLRLDREQSWQLGMGLGQRAALERKLCDEYFAGMREVLLLPVTSGLEALLSEVNAPGPIAVVAGARPYIDASAANMEDAYNALKTYLMLTDKSHAEAGHLNDQLTRYWRGWLEANRGAMTHEQLVRSAEKLLTFYLAHIDDSSWPTVEQKLTLVDNAREKLRHVARGMPARDRVYAEIKARASTRFPAMTVARMVGPRDQALVVGSYAVPGTFTREAWQGYIEAAMHDAATHALQSSDWVLKTAGKDDLTLEGSPEQIEGKLVAMYKSEYVKAWQKFEQGIAIAELNGFEGAVAAMNRLADAEDSPLIKVLNLMHEQTAWDNPGVMSAYGRQAQTGFFNWVKDGVMRRLPGSLGSVTVPPLPQSGQAAGQIGREFLALGKLVAAHDKDASLLRAYLDALAKLRARLNMVRNQGDPGPGARQLMQQTLEGSGSELTEALRYVDEQMLAGLDESQRQALRPLLVRPLMQSFAVIVAPAEAEINKTWLAQVYQPFNQTLANKYPFSPTAHIEASAAEIAQFFGPEGAVARFITASMGTLVVRRGDVLAPRTWADMGITLSPQALQRLPGWIAPIGSAGTASSSAAAQTVFQILPMPATGAAEYTVEIDGQQLRYRNTPPQWTNMVHPGPQGVPGARITAVALDGRSVELFNEPGQFGLRRMIDAAARTRKEGGVHELRWTSAGLTVALGLKITSSPGATGDAGTAGAEQGYRGLRLPETIVGGNRNVAVALSTPPSQPGAQ
jgi:type VI secretion system protein ImpL